MLDIGWIVCPLRHLYFGGPSLGGWGFWEGLGGPEMCSGLTGVPAKHWEGPGVTECDALLERKFVAFGIGVGALVFGVVAFQYLTRWILVRPIVSSLHKMSVNKQQTQV